MVCDRCADDACANNYYMSPHFEPGTCLNFPSCTAVKDLPKSVLQVMIPLAMAGVDTKLRQDNRVYFVDSCAHLWLVAGLPEPFRRAL